MLLSTRDAQRENQCVHILAAAAVTEQLSLTGIDNADFQEDSIFDRHGLSRTTSQSEIQSPPPLIIVDVAEERPTTNGTKQVKFSQKRRYHWRMTHYFYIHVSFFIVSGFIGGLIVYLIENYSSLRNTQMEVAYIDAWFVASSCVYSCGLTTLEFAQLSHASQIILMVFTFISGITISTLPALVIKAYTHKNTDGLNVDDDNDESPIFNIRRERNLPKNIQDRIASLPTAAQLRYRAYITCIVFTLGTCFTIYSIAFFAIGGWLTTQYTSKQLLQGNSSVNPWYISFIVTITGFNQNGLTPFSNGLSRFVHDVYLNLFVMMVVMSGTSLFPFILRNVILLARRLAPFRYKIIFDYIIMNHHRLSTLLFPAVQTRIYLSVTILLYILGVSISLILDLHSQNFAIYPSGTRFLIFLFQTINTRFAGFETIELSLLATATLLVYLVLMATKPQMLCALDESPFELSWLALQAREQVDAQTNASANLIHNPNLPLGSPLSSFSSTASGGPLPSKRIAHLLHRYSLATKDRARQQFANTAVVDGSKYKPKRLGWLRIRLFLIYFARALIKHTFSFVILTRTWLFFFIFLICAFEYRQMSPVDPNITVFKIIFEIISAFGTVGFSLGYPNITSSFATVLSPPSKIILIITMLMGRHRGLLASMKDQETIEYSAADLLRRQHEEIIYEYKQSKLNTDLVNEISSEEKIVHF